MNGEEMDIEVPDGFQKWYEDDGVLRMNLHCTGQNKLRIVSSRHLHRKLKIRPIRNQGLIHACILPE